MRALDRALADLEAGRPWMARDPEVAEAPLTLRQRYRHPVAAAQALGVRAGVRAFSPAAQARLRALQQEVRTAGGHWEPPGAPVAPRRRGPEEGDVVEPSHGGRLAGVLGWTVVLALVGVFVVGLVETAGAVAGLVGGLF